MSTACAIVVPVSCNYICLRAPGGPKFKGVEWPDVVGMGAEFQ